MKISLNWLNELLKTQLSADDVVSVLGTIGFQIEQIENKSQSITGVIVGDVTEVKPHPHADRLSLCTVSDGKKSYQVVCGASNVTKGIKVPFAPVGAILPGNIEIKQVKLRGVDSYGMICSARELGLPHAPQKGGIMVVPDSFEVGAEFEPTKCDELIASGEITL